MNELPLYHGALPQLANVDPKLAMKAAASPGAGLLGAGLARLGAGLAQQAADFHRLNDSAQFHLFARNQRERDARARMELQDGLASGKFRRPDGSIDMDQVEALKVRFREESEKEEHEFFFPEANQRFREAREEAVSGFGLFADESLRRAALRDADDTFRANFDSAMKVGDWQGAVAAISDANGTVLNPAQADGLLLDVRRAKAKSDLDTLLFDDPYSAFDALDNGGVDGVLAPHEIAAYQRKVQLALEVPRATGKRGKQGFELLDYPPGANDTVKAIIDRRNATGAFDEDAARKAMQAEAVKMPYIADPVKREEARQEFAARWGTFDVKESLSHRMFDIRQRVTADPNTFINPDEVRKSLSLYDYNSAWRETETLLDSYFYQGDDTWLPDARKRFEAGGLTGLNPEEHKIILAYLKNPKDREKEAMSHLIKEFDERRKHYMESVDAAVNQDWAAWLGDQTQRGITPTREQQADAIRSFYKAHAGESPKRDERIKANTVYAIDNEKKMTKSRQNEAIENPVRREGSAPPTVRPVELMRAQHVSMATVGKDQGDMRAGVYVPASSLKQNSKGAFSAKVRCGNKYATLPVLGTHGGEGVRLTRAATRQLGIFRSQMSAQKLDYIIYKLEKHAGK